MDCHEETKQHFLDCFCKPITSRICKKRKFLKLHSCSEFIESKDVCQLQKIYVLKDFLSMRIGFELQDSLLKKAKELGFNKVWLSVLNSNERAINFYKKTGFEEIGDHDFQIGKENFEFIAMLKTMA